MDNLAKRVRLLEVYATVLTLTIVVFLLSALRPNKGTQKFEEIDVERINVIESSGKPRLIISNEKRSPAGVMNGKTFGEVGGRPGIVFYNDEGDESGGMGTGGGVKDGKLNAFGLLAFDQHDQDQAVTLQYSDENGKRQMGLSVLDRPDVSLPDVIEQQQTIQRMPEGDAKQKAMKKWVESQGGVPYGTQRLFVGRDPSKSAVINLSDKFGRTRLRLAVDSTGTARIEFLNEKGEVTSHVPN